MQPTDHHDQFLTAGRWSERLIKPVARLDVPDSIRLLRDRPILFAGNHRSLFDVFATLAVLGRFQVSSRILIRADLVDSGATGVLLRRLGSIATSRTNRQEAEDSAVEALELGQTVSLMPEGRLVPPEERSASGVGPGRPGLSRIARRSGAAVIPVAFVGTDQVWPRGGVPRLGLPRPQVKIRFGEPMELTGDDDQANVDAFMAELGRLVSAHESAA
ncbi:MAG: 1-acyl-sn-glycerol-3-phosphate acyltransferase [Acidimicrobiia bacterium]|nr:1-acyl-sn-glycerol-3-phosphate acyltransferase [Acidimicrobiia bacterium]